MSFILDTVRSFDGVCACGRRHKTSVRDVRIGSGLVNSVGQILCENNFPQSILLVSDENAIKASEGIKSLRIRKGLKGAEQLCGLVVFAHINESYGG